jgi:hypothetical protein
MHSIQVQGITAHDDSKRGQRDAARRGSGLSGLDIERSKMKRTDDRSILDHPFGQGRLPVGTAVISCQKPTAKIVYRN